LLAQKLRRFPAPLICGVEDVGKGRVQFFGRRSAFQSALLSDFCRSKRKHRTLVHGIVPPKAMAAVFLQLR
jgi:hypothetical protein